jgi:gliding motility-associated protein GldE
MLLMIALSALLSGSEVALFSISSKQKESLANENSSVSNRILKLLEKPKTLLATILIANNFINVTIVILSTYLLNNIFNTNILDTTSQFIIQVIAVTLFILIFGEVIPKIYANNNNMSFSKFMALPILILSIVFKPFSKFLISSTALIDKKIEKKSNSLAAEELEHALDLAKDSVDNEDEKKILEGIVKFGSTDVKQIMTPRTDVMAFENSLDYKELINEIAKIKFSRIPIFNESFDQIKGVLYVKDLLIHIEKTNSFKWNTLLRKPKFVPENKKLDDLLKEFQEEKKHIAIVVDEYGGSSGIVTLEDVLEEIVGEITDEFDEEELVFKKIDSKNYLFEGKTSLIDVYKILEISGDEFEALKGESDTIAGFCIEQAGKILLKNEKVIFNNYTLTAIAADKRKIKQIKITINENP